MKPGDGLPASLYFISMDPCPTGKDQIGSVIVRAVWLNSFDDISGEMPTEKRP